MRYRFLRVLALATCLLSMHQFGFSQANPPRVHLIWMGGNDCPPCVYWRATELPKLQALPVFQEIKFSFVTKVVASAVPPGIFLDSEVKPYKDKLDHANSGRGGSPQGALLVDGEVYDYFVGVRSAQEIESMIKAAQTGAAYPFRRCLKIVGSRNVRRCEVPA